MKQRLMLLIVFVLVIAVLAGLNAASHQQKEKTPDSEFSPNRSSFNSGPTGTQAWYSLLTETGRRTVRWQQPPAALITAGDDRPNVFVIVGGLRRAFAEEDATSLLRWVSEGGRLVVIDRAPPEELTVSTSHWRITLEEPSVPVILSIDPSDQQQMTAETAAVRSAQPTVFTQSVNAIQPSRFAASIRLHRSTETGLGDGETMAEPGELNGTAPVVHFPLGDDGLIAEAPYGGGTIVFVGDPYLVSNGGIGLADNAQLAVNLVSMKDAVVAFDEYHQGYGTDNNRFVQFFAGTPVVAIFLQGVFLAGLVLYSRSRRFARPVPEPEPDRLSKLEYVSAMAELQRRTRAYDLAMENIYTPARVGICRVLGLDPMKALPSEIGRLAAERIGGNAATIEATLFKSEEIIRGEPTGKGETMKLIAEIRELEQKLGIRRTARSKDVG